MIESSGAVRQVRQVRQVGQVGLSQTGLTTRRGAEDFIGGRERVRRACRGAGQARRLRICVNLLDKLCVRGEGRVSIG